VLQCKRLDFHYCDWAGSSKGMKYVHLMTLFHTYLTIPPSSFLRHALPKFAAANPQIEMTVSPRPRKHPVIIGHYINGREKAICVRNLQKEQILEKAQLLRDASGEKQKRVTKPVKSINESVRGVWSPYHGGGIHV
jgi:large subunit ribosomal protein L43